jgi:hemerythrin-like domain-containing protein
VTATRLPLVSRRAVLLSGGGAAAGAAATGIAWEAADPASAAPGPAGLPPDDDLMREHGVLKRVLLCYREMITRLESGAPVSAAHIQDSALIIHDYIEGFHEGLEEGFVFPRLLRVTQFAGTVTTLLTQHARGRVITQFLLANATGSQLAKPGVKAGLAAAMQAFDRMYQPHEAREDTVVFPAFRQLVPPAELASLGQHFAELERQQFGTDEFTAMVNRVAAIENTLGIYDLDQFTPDVTRYGPPASTAATAEFEFSAGDGLASLAENEELDHEAAHPCHHSRGS